eukprot:COSAG01_NODE_2690_length_7247_cov_30.101567_5_plen_73_part_00
MGCITWLASNPDMGDSCEMPPRQLNIMGFTSGLMYFGYMFLASYAFAVGTGTIGFIACFIFVRAIYGSIKVD